jgi:hypothetical protein
MSYCRCLAIVLSPPISIAAAVGRGFHSLRFLQLGQIGDQSFDAIAGSIQNLFDFNSYDRRISDQTLILDPDTGEQVGQRALR